MREACHESGVGRVSITRVGLNGATEESDDISVEEPLEITVMTETEAGLFPASVAVTMRTPGRDDELAAGFLFTEGMITELADVTGVASEGRNLVRVKMRRGVVLDAALMDRHSVVSSSCGACGKRSIGAIRTSRRTILKQGFPFIAPELIHALPDMARSAQAEFSLTGGIHASALFDPDGNLLLVREDVGRHNALDKLIGAQLLSGNLPLDDRILVLSGRVSFELVQKAAMAGIPIIAAVGAPSSLAVELARECGMTLLGFVRNGRFNIYSDDGRIQGQARLWRHEGEAL